MLLKCFKIISALLVGLVLQQGFAQSVDYTVTQTPVGAPLPLENIKQNQSNALNLGDDMISGPVNLGFTFTFYGQEFSSTYISNNGVIGFQGAINGCCNGYDLNLSGNNYGIFALQTDLYNINTSNPYFRLSGTEGSREFTVGWYDMPIFADSNYRNNFEITLYEGSNNILLNYGDLNLGGRSFTAGIKGANGEYEIIHYGTGDLLEFTSFTLSSRPPPPPPIPEFLYWNKLVDENSSFTLTEPGVVRYGAGGSYIYQEFQPGTYQCSNSAWGNDPIGGVFKSCELGTNTEPVDPVNCVTDPTNQECAILALTDPEEIAGGIIDDILADMVGTNSEQSGDDGSIDGSNDGSEVVEEEEVLVAEENNTDIEELLQEENISDDEETSNNEETVVSAATESSSVIREMVNEEKASALADSINPNVLELALSVAENAVSLAVAGTEQASSTTASAASSSTRTSSSTDTSETKSEEIKSEQETLLVESGSEVATDLLDTGRNLNSISLAATQAQNEQSANESISQAENIAISSSETKSFETKEETVVLGSNQSVETISTETTVVASNEKQDIEQTTEVAIAQIDVVETVFQNNIVEFQTETEVINETQTMLAETTSDINAAQKIEEVVIEETTMTNSLASNVENLSETIDSFSDIVNLEIRPTDTTNEDVEFVQTILAQTEQKNDEINLGTFSEEEKVTIQNDPNLSNAFNVTQNVANLELLGVLNNKQEEKSDAEKRAEQVVAANKEQQEEINKNYMDADQSGIVAAISADTDVSSYRSAMLNDNNIWYKPEDIYKNVVYKDNVRGSYFLEKGNTDTYKKMVEEQYK